MKNLEKLQKDIDTSLGLSLSSYKKIKTTLEIGKKIYWYYKEDKRFCDKEKLDVKEMFYYEGVVVPKPEIEIRSGTLEPENSIVVITDCPCEKCYPESYYILLESLLNNKDLVEIYS